MDIQIKNYLFDKTAKTVTFTDYVAIRLDSVRIITNVESNIIIYNFAQPGLGGSVLDNVLTLDYDTSSMVNTDKLQIVYNDDEIKATESGIQSILTKITTLTEKLTIRVAENGTVTYVGEAIIGALTREAVWRIKRIDETSGVIILWADGNENFDNIWDNYASLIYN